MENNINPLENNIPPEEMNGPMGLPVESPPDGGGIQVQRPNPDKTVVCWNCLSVLIVRDEWNVVECSEYALFVVLKIDSDETQIT